MPFLQPNQQCQSTEGTYEDLRKFLRSFENRDPVQYGFYRPADKPPLKTYGFFPMYKERCNFFLGHLSTHTHTHLTALFPGLPGWTGTRKVKPIWILLKQETVSGSGISWAICKSAPRARQITTPALHHSVFLQAGCPSCRPTNSVKELKFKALIED